MKGRMKRERGTGLKKNGEEKEVLAKERPKEIHMEGLVQSQDFLAICINISK